MDLVGPYLFEFVWYEIQTDIQKDFVQNLNLLIGMWYFFKSFLPAEHFYTLPNSGNVCSIIKP